MTVEIEPIGYKDVLASLFRRLSRVLVYMNWANTLVAVTGALHILIAIVEIFLWRRKAVHQRLDFSEAEALKAAPIVANAGLYNCFLGIALLLAAMVPLASATPVQIYLLGCVIAAGLFGAVTLKWTTLVLQCLPGGLALLAVLLGV